MSLGQVNNTLGILGSAAAPRLAPVRLPAAIEPKLHVAWGEFRQSFASSVVAVFARAGTWRKFFVGPHFRDCIIERRLPRRAMVAAALWHVALFVMPFPQLPMSPARNHALDNVELTWSGPINDLPLLDIPGAKPKPNPRSHNVEPPKVDGFHPRQRIFTDPVHPTHPRQTLINPAAPPAPPKLLPNLPNIVQLQPMAAPPRPRLQISAEALAKLHPRQRRVATVTSTPLPDIAVPDQKLAAIAVPDQKLAAIPMAPSASAPVRPKLELNTGATPRIAPRAQPGDTTQAPDLSANQPVRNGNPAAFIALSATPAPPAPTVQPPQGNLSAPVSISPEGPKPGGSPATGNGSGKSSVGVSISGGNPPANAGVSGLGGPPGKISMPSARPMATRPDSNGKTDDPPERTGPPNFAALPVGAKPEQIFASKRVYTLYVNMANLNSASGSWIMNFSELRASLDAPRMTSSDLSGPVPIKKVDPKYPPTLMADNVQGEVILYAVIRADGSVDSIQLVHGIDEQLDANAMDALSQWKFRPASKAGVPLDLEAIVHIPFHVRDDR